MSPRSWLKRGILWLYAWHLLSVRTAQSLTDGLRLWED
jgi:hypothetical protein